MACKIEKLALKAMQKKCSSQKIYNRIPAFRLKIVRYKMGRINHVHIKFTFQVSPFTQKMSVKYERSVQKCLKAIKRLREKSSSKPD